MPGSDLAALVDQLGYLAEPELAPARWAALSRFRRLFDIRFRDPLGRARPLLVALLGGTNTGKSTVFNLLLGQAVARSAPTPVATKAVVLSALATWQAALEDPALLPGWLKLPWQSPDDSLQAFEDGQPRLYLHLRAAGLDVALADTPDIDSVRRFNEREAEDLFYLSDALIYVTSEQKYADEACAEYVRRAVQHDKAVLAVLNRASADGVALADFTASKLPSAGLRDPEAVLAVPLLPDIEAIAAGQAPAPAAVEAVRAEVAKIAERAPELQLRATRGAARGLAAELEAALEPLLAERDQVDHWRAGAEQALAAAGQAYRPNLLDPDDVDQAVLEALEELKVPGLDWIYDQLGVVGKRVRLAWRLFGRRLSGSAGQPLRGPAELAAERASREADQVRRLLAEAQAGLRRELGVVSPELKGPLLDRVPDLAGEAADRAVAAWLERVETARGAIVADAKAKILEDMRKQGLAIKGIKAVTRTASMALSVAIALHTGQVGAHDLALAPVADAATKLVLDKLFGADWRRQLQEEVNRRRREVFTHWLGEVCLQPALAALPPALGDGFAERLRAAVSRLANGEES